MATNPNPSLITDAIWWTWEQERAGIPGAQLGGIYANKSGYHNTVKANQKTWPGGYSIRYPLDLNYPPKDKARGLDTTLSTSEMIKRTGYLKKAAEHPNDNRLWGLREFIGTLDGRKVFCMIRDTDSGPWRVDWSRDSSHLWHIHKSWWTRYCADMDAAEAIVSVELGVTWEEWEAGMALSDADIDKIATKSAEKVWAKLYRDYVELEDGTRPGRTTGELLMLARQDSYDAKKILEQEGTVPPAVSTKIDDAVTEIKKEIRDAAGDLGEGGAAQVRADTDA